MNKLHNIWYKIIDEVVPLDILTQIQKEYIDEINDRELQFEELFRFSGYTGVEISDMAKIGPIKSLDKKEKICKEYISQLSNEKIEDLYNRYHVIPRMKMCQDWAKNRTHGMINTGQYLGLMFGPIPVEKLGNEDKHEVRVVKNGSMTKIKVTGNIPCGWIYVCTNDFPDKKQLADIFYMCLEELDCGRSNWPENLSKEC